MKESVLSKLKRCLTCEKMTLNDDGLCDTCAEDDLTGVEDHTGDEDVDIYTRS